MHQLVPETSESAGGVDAFMGCKHFCFQVLLEGLFLLFGFFIAQVRSAHAPHLASQVGVLIRNFESDHGPAAGPHVHAETSRVDPC